MHKRREGIVKVWSMTWWRSTLNRNDFRNTVGLTHDTQTDHTQQRVLGIKLPPIWLVRSFSAVDITLNLTSGLWELGYVDEMKMNLYGLNLWILRMAIKRFKIIQVGSHSIWKFKQCAKNACTYCNFLLRHTGSVVDPGRFKCVRLYPKLLTWKTVFTVVDTLCSQSVVPQRSNYRSLQE